MPIVAMSASVTMSDSSEGDAMSEGVKRYPNLDGLVYGTYSFNRGKVSDELAEAERTAVRLERMSDLVRYKRAELHNDGLISDEEYAEIVQDHAAVARLEGYDAIKGELEGARKRIAELEEFIKRLADADVYAFDGTRDTGMVLIPSRFQAEAVSLARDGGQS